MRGPLPSFASPVAMVLAAAMAGACNPPAREEQDRFSATGEIVALGGGGAGADNACFTCHGLDGEGDGAGTPRLAGLSPGYLERQMQFYASGLRQHAEMQAIAESLSFGERKAVSAYYAALPSTPAVPVAVTPAQPATVPAIWSRGAPDRGIPACAACHGMRGEGVGAGNPPLAGQPAGYLAEQMRKWRSGERRGDPMNMMLKISQRLTPPEIAALSAHAAALPGGDPRPRYREAFRQERRPDPTNDASAQRPRGAE